MALNRFFWKIPGREEVLVKTNEKLFEIVKEETFDPPLGPNENDFGIGFQYSRITIENTII